MSYDLIVYTESDQPTSRMSLMHEMRRLGWEVRFVNGWDQMTLPDNLMDADLVIGWRTDDPTAANAATLVAQCDHTALEQLFEDISIASCGFSISTYEPEEEYIAEIDAGYAEPLRKAKLEYDLRTKGASGVFSFQLQEALWWAIGNATGGLLDDPQGRGICQAREKPAPVFKWITAESFLDRPPWWVIGWYSFFAILGVILVATGRNPISAQHWYVSVMFVYGALAIGLYRRSLWAWRGSVVLTGLILIFAVVGIFAGSFTKHKLPFLLFQVYMMYRLLDDETKTYFVD